MDPKEGKIEHIPGCPLCEHSDPELDRDLERFAQLLFDVFLERQMKKDKKTEEPEKK